MKMKMVTKNQNGATAVEFAIILNLLIVIIFGTIELSLYLFNKHVITNASREGARAGIVTRLDRLENDQIKTVVLDYCEDHLVTLGTSDSPQVTILPIDEGEPFDPATERCISFGCDLKVEITYNYSFLVLSNLGFEPKVIKAVTVMKME